MQKIFFLLWGTFVAGLIGCDPPSDGKSQAVPGHQSALQGLDESKRTSVPGRTQCVLGRKGMIAPVPLHPVVEVLVKPGDRVKKGQPLVKLDDDEAQADVRSKQAALENATIALAEARRYLTASQRAAAALPEQKLHEARVSALKAEQDQRSAKAALESSQAELEHYTVVALIDGVVAWLDVHPGMVSRPGTTVWGEILDLSELDVCCELTPEQAEGVTLGQEAEVQANGGKEVYGVGKVAFVGIAADKATGLVPVLVRLANPKGRLRCEVPVRVHFKDNTAIPAER
jgi:RND family efflux transporter MFP subunit